MARKRDYRAEYRRRIARAEAKGYSKAIARGHAPKGKAGLRAAEFLGIKPGEDLQGKRPSEKEFFDTFRGSDSNRDYIFAGYDRNGLVKWRLRTVVEDSQKVFSSKPRRQHGEDAATYEERLAEYQKRNGRFEWSNEAAFIKSMLTLGLTATEAYTHWFSP